MTIKIACPGCGKVINAKDRYAGKKAKCPGCKTPVLIPDPEGLPTLEPIEEESVAPSGASPYQQLFAAAKADRLDQMAQVLWTEHLWLVSGEPGGEDDMVPIIMEADDTPFMVSFLSQQVVQQFADNNPELTDERGAIGAFQVHSFNVFEQLQEPMGIAFHPEDDDAIFLDFDAASELREHLRSIASNPASMAAQPPRLPTDGDPRATELRAKVMSKLHSKGFRPADWLPTPDLTRKLRPREEIAGRILSLAAVFAWGSAPEDAVSSQQLKSFIKTGRLGQWLTDQEQQIIGTPRQQAMAEHAGSVGWKLENMWPLAWVLGFPKVPVVAASMIPEEVMHPLVFEFVGGFDQSIEGLLSKSELRKAGRVNAMEDYFYCAHNAVRSAQVGSEIPTVPTNFDPVVHGGVVHERRHSLTWCLSPGVPWDDTDLST